VSHNGNHVGNQDAKLVAMNPNDVEQNAEIRGRNCSDSSYPMCAISSNLTVRSGNSNEGLVLKTKVPMNKLVNIYGCCAQGVNVGHQGKCLCYLLGKGWRALEMSVNTVMAVLLLVLGNKILWIFEEKKTN